MLTLLLAGALAASPLADAERAFTAFRDAEDRARASPSTRREGARRREADRTGVALDRIDPRALAAEDRRAADAMRRALAPAAEAPDAFTRSVYEAYGRAAGAIAFEGETLDRLTILSRLASEPDAGRRRRLFLALAPVWSSVAGDPYARLVAARRAAWTARTDGSPFDRKAREWGLTPEEMETSLVRVLEAWRDHMAPSAPIEPWNWYFAQGAADRAVDARLPLPAIVATAIRYYGELDASPRPLGIALELEPRPGKDPVAFTDFVRHGRYARGSWRGGRFRVSASYRTGGLGNLYELMHELGHGIHIAAIRARPAFNDWPDSDVLTEALADVFGVEVYEPAWQRRYVGVEARAGDALRARLSGTVLDVAWAVFEMRAHRDPSADVNVLWAEITSRYLGIVPHPELAWWAMRGQLVDAPGYMTNYALGAILTEALRARVRALRGETAFETPSPELYGWLSERLYRFGLARPSRELVGAFLGGPLSTEPLAATISKAAGAD